MHEDLLKEQHLEAMRQLKWDTMSQLKEEAMRQLKEDARLKQDEAIRQANEEGRLMVSQYVRNLTEEAMCRPREGEDAMRNAPRSASLANMQDPHRPLEPGEWRDCNTPAAPVDPSPLHGPNYRNLPAFLAGRDRVIISEICEHLGIRYSRAEAVRIGRELRARAWRPSLWRVDGKIVSGFHRPGLLRPRQRAKGETGLVYSQYVGRLAGAAMRQPQDMRKQLEWEKRAKQESVNSDAAPPAVGFWRRLLNLLTGGDR